MIFAVVQDDEVILLKALNGEINMHVRHFNTLQNKPVLARNEEKGDYHLFDTIPDFMNEMVIQLNLTHRDETKREIFQNRDFRIGALPRHKPPGDNRRRLPGAGRTLPGGAEAGIGTVQRGVSQAVHRLRRGSC